MTKLPVPTGKDLIAALSKAGFEVIRIKGSYFKKQGYRCPIICSPEELLGDE